MRRFFIPAENLLDKKATITGSDVHHIIHVLRKKVGDEIAATDGMGNLLRTRVLEIWESMIQLEILEKKPSLDRKTFVRLFQAIPKGNKFDLIVEKACELGVDELIPVVTERTITKINQERGLKKLARWERISLEAAKQVGRASVMGISHTLSFAELEKKLSAFSLKIVPWESEEEKSLKKLLTEQRGAKELDILIGPEGGLSFAEIEQLKGYGFQSVSLGKRILKAETAAITTLGNIYFALED